MSLPRSILTDTRIGKILQTRFAGRFFRSRTEARWAVLFDAMHLRFEYEPEGYVLRNGKCYLPDFYIHEWDAWFEVKPTTDRQFAHSFVHTLSLLRRLTHAKNAYVAFGSPDLIRQNAIVNESCVYPYVGGLGPTHDYPNDLVSDAYRAAMEERFERKSIV